MNILIILGHPNTKSFNAALADAYEAKARDIGHSIRRINLSDLKFDPILHKGYSKEEIQELEPDLIKSQEDITWATHIVIFYPMWWGDIPALLKSFIERTILPGFGFKYHKNNPLWDKLLTGRSGHIIRTTSSPSLWAKLVIRNTDIRILKHTILKFCGINPVKITSINNLKNSTQEKREKYIQKVIDSVPYIEK